MLRDLEQLIPSHKGAVIVIGGEFAFSFAKRLAFFLRGRKPHRRVVHSHASAADRSPIPQPDSAFMVAIHQPLFGARSRWSDSCAQCRSIRLRERNNRGNDHMFTSCSASGGE